MSFTNHAAPIAVHAYVANILTAANSLLRDGRLSIVGFRATGQSSAATIEVLDCQHVRQMVRKGLATYDRQGCDAHGAFRVGQYQRCGVNIEWTERGF